MGSRDHSIECDVCGESYGGMNAESEEHECDPVSAEMLRLANESIASWTPEFAHDMCTDGGETCDDDRCWWHVGRPALERLAANLAVAAQLCAHAEALTRNVQRWMDGRCELWQPNAEGRGL